METKKLFSDILDAFRVRIHLVILTDIKSFYFTQSDDSAAIDNIQSTVFVTRMQMGWMVQSLRKEDLDNFLSTGDSSNKELQSTLFQKMVHPM